MTKEEGGFRVEEPGELGFFSGTLGEPPFLMVALGFQFLLSGSDSFEEGDAAGDLFLGEERLYC